jgi:hypothetical protein
MIQPTLWHQVGTVTMLLIWDVTSAADAKDYFSACLAPGD